MKKDRIKRPFKCKVCDSEKTMVNYTVKDQEGNIIDQRDWLILINNLETEMVIFQRACGSCGAMFAHVERLFDVYTEEEVKKMKEDKAGKSFLMSKVEEHNKEIEKELNQASEESK